MPFVEYDEVGAVCADCGRTFPSEEARDRHQADVHVTAPGRTPRRAAPARVRCAVCRGQFPTVAALSDHNRSAHSR